MGGQMRGGSRRRGGSPSTRQACREAQQLPRTPPTGAPVLLDYASHMPSSALESLARTPLRLELCCSDGRGARLHLDHVQHRHRVDLVGAADVDEHAKEGEAAEHGAGGAVSSAAGQSRQAGRQAAAGYAINAAAARAAVLQDRGRQPAGGMRAADACQGTRARAGCHRGAHQTIQTGLLMENRMLPLTALPAHRKGGAQRPGSRAMSTKSCADVAGIESGDAPNAQ